MTSPISEPDTTAANAVPAPAPAGRLRRWWPILSAAVLAVAGIIALVLSLGSGGAGTPTTATPGEDPDRTSPAAVATQFLARYAAHDPAACSLGAARLRTILGGQGRCAGNAITPAPVTSVLFGPIVCGDRAGVGARITQPGQGDSFAFVGLTVVTGAWTVTSVVTGVDRSALAPYTCDTPSPDDGG